jgi:hypothetical protein
MALRSRPLCQEACPPRAALGCPASWLPLFFGSKTPVSTHVRISAGKRFHIQTLETSPRGVEGGAREPLRALRTATYHRRAYMPPICLHRAIIIRLPRNYPAQRDQRPTLDHAFPNGVPGPTRRRCQGLLEADLGSVISASRDPLTILCPCSLPVASRKMRGPGRGC